MEAIAGYDSSDDDACSSPRSSSQSPAAAVASQASLAAHDQALNATYPTHVFIDVPLPQQCLPSVESFLQVLQRRCPDLSPVEPIPEGLLAPCKSPQDAAMASGGPLAQPRYHLSLSRTAPLHLPQIDPLVASLRLHLRQIPPFTTSLHFRPEILFNDAKTRAFLVLPVTARPTTTAGLLLASRRNLAASTVVAAVHAVSEAFHDHGLPRYYENPRPHVSLAWVPGEQAQQLKKALHEDAGVLLALHVLQSVEWSVAPAAVCCRSGIKRQGVWRNES